MRPGRFEPLRSRALRGSILSCSPQGFSHEHDVRIGGACCRKPSACLRSGVVRSNLRGGGLYCLISNAAACDATTLRAAMENAFRRVRHKRAWDWKTAYDACRRRPSCSCANTERRFPQIRFSAARLVPLTKIASLLPTHAAFFRKTRASSSSQRQSRSAWPRLVPPPSRQTGCWNHPPALASSPFSPPDRWRHARSPHEPG